MLENECTDIEKGAHGNWKESARILSDQLTQIGWRAAHAFWTRCLSWVALLERRSRLCTCRVEPWGIVVGEVGRAQQSAADVGGLLFVVADAAAKVADFCDEAHLRAGLGGSRFREVVADLIDLAVLRGARFDEHDDRFDHLDGELINIRATLKQLRTELDDLRDKVDNITGYRTFSESEKTAHSNKYDFVRHGTLVSPTMLACAGWAAPAAYARHASVRSHACPQRAEAGGVIDYKRGTIIILDRKALEKSSNGTYVPSEN